MNMKQLIVPEDYPRILERLKNAYSGQHESLAC